MVLDFKGFLGAVLLESCSVHFGYTECVPFIGLHFPPECVPSIGLHLPRIQSNDLSYTVSVSHISSPTICPTWSKQMSYSVTIHHINVSIVGFLDATPSSRNRKTALISVAIRGVGKAISRFENDRRSRSTCTETEEMPNDDESSS